MAITQSDLLQALGWAVFNSLWQMAILWVAYQLITSIFRITKSSQKAALGAFLLFAGFTWFTFTLVFAFAGHKPGDSYAGLMNIRGNAALNDWLNTMLPLASILYLILLLLPILNFIRNYRYVQVIRRYGLSRADVQWRMFVQKIAVRMGVRKQVYVWMSELVSSPVTIGYLKPVILLPMAAINHLNTQQIEAVLLHELSHIKRYDYFINLLVKLIQTVLYFNPFVKAFIKIIETEREKNCDETVMQFQYEPHGYASALLILEKAAHVPHHSLAVAASDGRKGQFLQRIEWILGINKKPAFSFNRLAGVVAGLLCFIALNAVLIMSKPVKSEIVKDSFAFIASPYEFFADKYDKTRNASLVVPEQKTAPVINNPVAEGTPGEENTTPEEKPEQPGIASAEDITAAADALPFNFVYNMQNVIPELNAAQENQVQQAIVESKKVIQEIQWKDVEKHIADAMTIMEKEEVKQEYKKAADKMDWNNLSDQLRIAYDRIDWNKINCELDNALAEIKLDSLQTVYTIAIKEISGMQKELVKVNQPGIPDTDVTVKSLETQKIEMQKFIDKIKSAKPKKVVHL